MKRKFLLILLTVLVVFSMLSVVAMAADTPTSGSCGANGDNVTWSYDESTKTLTISGSGEMYNFYYNNPWAEIRKTIQIVIIEDGITSVGSYSFYSLSSLTSITIPDSVTSIGNNAFKGCSSLIGVTIPDSVTSIGANAFDGCSSLTNVTIPGSIQSIGMGAFRNCGNLSITVCEGVTHIGNEWFNQCDSLVDIKLPESLLSIGNDAFAYCRYLKSVVIPHNVTSIDDYAFYGCRSLADITIPGSVKSIGAQAFHGCSSLNSIFVPDSLKYLGYAFGGCNNLTDVIVENNPEMFDRSHFGNFLGLENCMNINIGANNPDYCSVDGVVYNKDKTKLILFPNGRHSLSSIPESVNEFGDYVFGGYNVNLESVVIPNTIKSIGGAFTSSNDVLDDFPNLGEIYYGGSESDWEKCAGVSIFSNVTKYYNGEIPDKQEQVFDQSFTEPITKTYGDEAFTKIATLTQGNGTITYASSNQNVATVDNNGKVTIKGAGTTTITARVKSTGSYSSATVSYVLTVNKQPLVFEQSFAQSVTKVLGDSAFVKLASGVNDYYYGPIYYDSSNKNVTTVYNSGRVIIKGLGTTTITATVLGDNNHEGDTISYTLTVSDSPISKSTVTVKVLNKNIPMIVGKVPDLSNPVENVDYTVTGLKDGDKLSSIVLKYYLNGVEISASDIDTTKPGVYDIVAVATVDNSQGYYYDEIQCLTGTLRILSTGGGGGEEQTFNQSFAQAVTKTMGDSQFTKTATLTQGNGTITYDSSNQNVATVDNNGKVTIKGVGTTTITATAAETVNYKQATISYTLTVSNSGSGSETSKSTVRVEVKNKSLYTENGVPPTIPDLSNPVENVDYTVTGLKDGDTLSSITLKYYHNGKEINAGDINNSRRGKYYIIATATINNSQGKYNDKIEYSQGRLNVYTHKSGMSGGGYSSCGIIKGEPFYDESYADNILLTHFVDNEDEDGSNRYGIFGSISNVHDGDFIVFNCSEDMLEIHKVYPKKKGINEAQQVVNLSDGVLTFNKSMNCHSFGEETFNGTNKFTLRMTDTEDGYKTKVYVIDSETGEYKIGSFADITKGAYAYVPYVHYYGDYQAGAVIVDKYTKHSSIGGGGSSGGGGGGSVTPPPTKGKPTVSTNGNGGTVSADDNGKVTITPNTGYKVKDVTVNGKSVGAKTELTGLTADDKVVVTLLKD